MVRTRSYTQMLKRQRKRKEMQQESGDLPLDIIADILLGFSVKTLTQFKCVCKSWCNLIEDPIFMNRHYKYSEKHKKTFFKACFGIAAGFSTQFYAIGKDCIAKFRRPKPFDCLYLKHLNMASCNGLICSIDFYNNIQICNPTTEETVLLPNPTLPKTGIFNRKYNRTIMLGFGFDSIMKKYKVLCWDFRDGSYFLVFTFGTESWRDVECSYPCEASNHSIAHFGFPVYLNGMSHWYYENKILSFDFSKEIFLISLLPEGNQVNMVSKIFEVRGCLCVVGQVNISGSGDIVKIWFLENFKDQKWVCKQVILPWFGSTFRANVVLVRDGEILMQSNSSSSSQRELYLFAYNEVGHVTSWFKVASEGYGMFQSYTESFVSLRRCRDNEQYNEFT